jgi:hypothetical protein
MRLDFGRASSKLNDVRVLVETDLIDMDRFLPEASAKRCNTSCQPETLFQLLVWTLCRLLVTQLLLSDWTFFDTAHILRSVHRGQFFLE